MEIGIDMAMVAAARDYAVRSAAHTSNRHDFHSGRLADKARNMFVGKLGERAFQAWLETLGVEFVADASPPTEADRYDFLVGGKTIDVKTFTQEYHTRLLEMVEQYAKLPKDCYVAVRLRFGPFDVQQRGAALEFDFAGLRERTAHLVGWAGRAEVGSAPVENNGYRDNYRIWLRDLRDMPQLAAELRRTASNRPTGARSQREA